MRRSQIINLVAVRNVRFKVARPAEGAEATPTLQAAASTHACSKMKLRIEGTEMTPDTPAVGMLLPVRVDLRFSDGSEVEIAFDFEGTFVTPMDRNNLMRILVGLGYEVNGEINAALPSFVRGFDDLPDLAFGKTRWTKWIVNALSTARVA